MAIDVINIEIIETTENFVDHIRPPEEMRDTLDINYRKENQSVILFEIRPSWTDNSEILHHDFAKTT